jgi:Fe2+ or Zn2+ uptake regulation protein
LSESDFTATAAHQEYNQRFSNDKHRESIYRELENLTESGFLNKNYDADAKELRYSLCFEAVEIDLRNSEANVVCEDN